MNAKGYPSNNNAFGRRARIQGTPIRELLRRLVPGKGRDLDSLFDRVQPSFEVDHDDDRILFQADSGRNLITVGLKCIWRLQAHLISAGVVFAAFRVPCFRQLSSDERMPLLAPADQLLTWAVALELQESLRQLQGFERRLDEIFPDVQLELPAQILPALSENQRRLGMLIFEIGSAFILLHELGHLNYRHRREHGVVSFEQEKEADRFAAEWLLSSTRGQSDGVSRISALVGIAVALLWITVFNIFLGPKRGDTHPEGYDRLFQLLDYAIDRDSELENGVWDFVCQMLFSYMRSAGFTFSPESYPQDDDPRAEANYLIDQIANRQCRRSGSA